MRLDIGSASAYDAGMTTDNDIKLARTNAANSDMRRCRKSVAGITIVGTSRGNLDLSYFSGEYTLSNMNTGELIANGAAGVVREVLAAAYVVTVAD